MKKLNNFFLSFFIFCSLFSCENKINGQEKNDKNSMENINKNEKILSHMKSNTENISLIDYSFSLEELFFLLKTDNEFRENWIKYISTIYNINYSKSEELYIDYSILLFKRNLKSINTNFYEEEKFLIEKNIPEIKNNLIDHDYQLMMTIKTDEAWEIPNNCYILLLCKGMDYLNYVEKDKSLLSRYEEWLNETMEIWQFEDNVDYPIELYQRPLKFLSQTLTSSNDISKKTILKINELLSKYSKKTYIISDPDGYTNLRKEKNSKSEILQQIKNGEKVEVLDNEGSWWLVKTKEGKQGYVYFDRVKAKN